MNDIDKANYHVNNNDNNSTGTNKIEYPAGIDSKKIEAAQKLQKLDSTLSVFSGISSVFGQIFNIFRFLK